VVVMTAHDIVFENRHGNTSPGRPRSKLEDDIEAMNSVTTVHDVSY
jgi:hypothetical protein